MNQEYILWGIAGLVSISTAGIIISDIYRGHRAGKIYQQTQRESAEILARLDSSITGLEQTITKLPSKVSSH